MIRLFIKFTVSMILLGLACKWIFYRLLEDEVYTDRERVVSGMTEVHIGGLHVLASELADAEDEQTRQLRCEAIKQEFRSPIEIRRLDELTDAERSRLSNPTGFIYSYRNEIIDCLGVPLDTDHYLRLGPIAYKTGAVIEDEAVDWLRFLARKMEGSSDVDRLLEEISLESRVPVRLRSLASIPVEARQRLDSGLPAAFYGLANKYYVVMPLENRKELLSLGPLPKVRELARKTLNTTLGLCFACIIGTTGWLVFSVSGKFRRIEIAAKRITEGRFDVRVDESKAGESKMLANAFNRMASKTESSIRSKNELLQVVAHEIRTPLARLRFAVELLDVSKNEEHKRARMMIMRQSIDNLDAIVDGVLDYVRNEDSEPAKAREWIEIQRSVEPMISVYELEYPKLRFEWVFAGSPQSTEIYADRISFHCVIGNLLSNAVRYARSTVRIHVSLFVERCGAEQANGAPTEAICVEVEDDGPGIPEDQRREILAPFVRLSPHESPSNTQNNTMEQEGFAENAGDLGAESEDADSHAGLGLGLAIVDRFLKQHGGWVFITEGELGGCLVRTFWPIPVSSR